MAAKTQLGAPAKSSVRRQRTVTARALSQPLCAFPGGWRGACSSRSLPLFPTAAQTNDHRLGGLKPHTRIILWFWRSEGTTGLCPFWRL